MNRSNKREFPLPDWLGNPTLSMLLIAATALGLRLFGMGESLWLDEIYYSTSYDVASYKQLLQTIIYKPEAPMYRSLLLTWSPLWHENEIWVRVPSLLLGIASIVLTFQLARTRCSENAAKLAAFLMAFSPVHIWYSQEGTHYSLAIFLILSTAVSLDRITREPANRWWFLAHFVSLWAAVFTHFFCFFFVIALAFISGFFTGPVRNRLLGIYAAIALSFAAVIALRYFKGNLATGISILRPLSLLDLWTLFFHYFLQGNSLWTFPAYANPLPFFRDHPLFVLTQVAAFAVFVNGVVHLPRQNGTSNTLLFMGAFFAIPAALFVLTFVGFDQLYIERYATETLPFFFIVIGHGATMIQRAWLRHLAVLSLVLISLASTVAFMVKRDDTWTVYKPNPDWRSAADFLADRDLPENPSAVLVAREPAGLDYYLTTIEAGGHFDLERFAPATLESALEQSASGEIFLVENLFWRAINDELPAIFQAHPGLSLVSATRFKGIIVYELSWTQESEVQR